MSLCMAFCARKMTASRRLMIHPSHRAKAHVAEEGVLGIPPSWHELLRLHLLPARWTVHSNAKISTCVPQNRDDEITTGLTSMASVGYELHEPM